MQTVSYQNNVSSEEKMVGSGARKNWSIRKLCQENSGKRQRRLHRA